jgi:hypothetical protein
MNDKNFEDNERTEEKILSLFFETLYLWMVAYVSPLSFSYNDSLFVLLPYFFLYIFCVLRDALRF